MASIRKEIRIEAAPEEVWDAVRDVDAVHQRLCPGVLTDSRREGGFRVVTFANGLVVRELLVDLDDATRRFAYSAQGGSLEHHHASMQVFADAAGGTRLVWTIDLLPDAMATPIAGLMDAGAAAMRAALERPIAA